MHSGIFFIAMYVKLNLIGQKTGKLTVESFAGKDKHGKYLWKCKCDCGNYTIINSHRITHKLTLSCGCKRKEVVNEVRKHRNLKDLTGEKIGHLTVLSETENTTKYIGRAWLCLCECGNTCIKTTSQLKTRKTCGCAKQFIFKKEKPQKPKIDFNDIIGKQFYKLTVIEYIGKTNYKCICTCGKETIAQRTQLLNGKRKSCGCLRGKNNNNPLKGPKEDLTGKRFGLLTVTNIAQTKKDKNYCWECICDCGNTTVVPGNALKAGLKQSCGCINSLGEAKIQKILITKNINFQKEYSFEDLRGTGNGKLRFDFAILSTDGSLKCLIEYQGEQHYNVSKANPEFGKQQREITDKQKKDYCKEHNIALYEIRYDDDVEVALNEILDKISKTTENSMEALYETIS